MKWVCPGNHKLIIELWNQDKVQVGYCWVVCHKPLWSDGTVSWSQSLISVHVNIPTSKLCHVTTLWGVSRQVSKSPVDCWLPSELSVRTRRCSAELIAGVPCAVSLTRQRHCLAC